MASRLTRARPSGVVASAKEAVRRDAVRCARQSSSMASESFAKAARQPRGPVASDSSSSASRPSQTTITDDNKSGGSLRDSAGAWPPKASKTSETATTASTHRIKGPSATPSSPRWSSCERNVSGFASGSSPVSKTTCWTTIASASGQSGQARYCLREAKVAGGSVAGSKSRSLATSSAGLAKSLRAATQDIAVIAESGPRKFFERCNKMIAASKASECARVGGASASDQPLKVSKAAKAFKLASSSAQHSKRCLSSGCAIFSRSRCPTP
mmetsp:Transcript_30115/g.104063  ORF Transcript_30115/g.104063 Transcript_30115/m.104063 type:complete len:270 (+) Transcript_30115:180-989(+)